MLVVGLTGGIGSGKSTIAEMFRSMGVPVYDADLRAKSLMNRSEEIKEQIIWIFGKESYTEEGTLNRTFLADRVFGNTKELAALNNIVHPAVNQHFVDWVSQQQSPYVLYEAAILFEHGGHEKCDKVITVIAPEQERITRVIQRDNTTRKAVERRMEQQWEDEQRMPLSDYIIANTDLENTRRRVLAIHEDILEHVG